MNRRWFAMAAVALSAGCGGSDDAVYDLWETDSCLLDKGYSPTLVETNDPAALRGEPGANGVLEIKADGKAIDIRFEDDSAAAIARAGLLESRQSPWAERTLRTRSRRSETSCTGQRATRRSVIARPKRR